jgi:3-oxoacyl-[acyl-carrier-protein] synthase II
MESLDKWFSSRYSHGMASSSEIVITGAGIVSPIGIGVEPFWAALCEGRSGIRRLAQFDSPILPPVLGGEVADFDPKQYVRPRKSLKVMSRDVQLGFTAADLACADSRLRETPIDPERMGVMLGADLISCELDELVGTYRKCVVDGQFDFDRWGAAAKAELYPLWMLKYLPNMPACHIGIAQDARGPNNTITLGDVSTLSALAEAARVLERGNVDAMIAGGVNSRLNPMLWVRSHVFGQSRRSGDPAAASRPFDATRDGLVDGEGAAAFILETRPHAESRGATILGRIGGFASVFQPSANGQPRIDVAIARAIAAALASAGLKPAEVGFVVAHGMGTIDGDRFEATAIREVLGDVPVTSPKSYFGYLGAASGALETAVGLLSLQNGQVPPTLNYEHPDPQCPINVVRGRPLPIERSTALILSYSPQGQATALVLGGG